jgi:2-dehydro-3-deoxyphosphooctonate aldolase (KDO 8-P synthase)
MPKTFRLNDLVLGQGQPFLLIAGPDVIESEEHAVDHAGAIKEITGSLGIPYIFKASYDKANRSSHKSFRGPGLEKGLSVLAKVKSKTGVPVLSDVHSIEEIAPAAEVLDVIQIPAFLCRQTSFIQAVAKSGTAVNIKKGQFVAPWDVKNIVEKVRSAGNERIFISERGTSFGYNNLVSDMRSLSIMREYGYPVIYDATHSVQLPGGLGHASGGQREFVLGLSRAACGMGCDGLFLEIHRTPDSAPCDGPNMLPLDQLESLLRQAKQIHDLVSKQSSPELAKKP